MKVLDFRTYLVLLSLTFINVNKGLLNSASQLIRRILKWIAFKIEENNDARTAGIFFVFRIDRHFELV
jgi:hypothetical protein